MSSETLDRSLSSLSIHSSGSMPEDDWDPLESQNSVAAPQFPTLTPRNSIIFPAEDTPGRKTRYHSREGSLQNGNFEGRGSGKRTLSELLRLHSEKTSNGEFSQEEASRIADVLGQWINASSSPYEGEDDFFSRHSQDDINLNAARRILGVQGDFGRPRGRSESANS
ncbi:hypothetical protein CPB83DRAFT_752667, partial [Crepidotus variabilis]